MLENDLKCHEVKQVQRSQKRVTYKKVCCSFACSSKPMQDGSLAMANAYEGLKLRNKRLLCLAENYQLVDMARNYGNLLQPS